MTGFWRVVPRKAVLYIVPVGTTTNEQRLTPEDKRMRFFWIGFILLALLSSTVFSGSDERALVLIRSKQPGTAAMLLDTGIMVVRDTGPYLLAVADETGRGEMQKRGIVFEILDKNVEGHTYYTADIRNERLAQIAESRVDILKRHDRLIIFNSNGDDYESTGRGDEIIIYKVQS